MSNLFFSTKYGTNTVHFCLFILRVGLGVMMLNHGLPKLMHFNGIAPDFFDPLQWGSPFMLSLVVFAEVLCSVLLILGLLTRWITIPLIIQMVVVILMVHGNDGFGKQELGAHYLLGFVVIWLLGPGKISLDRLISKH